MAKGLFVVDFDGTFLRDDKTLAAIDRDALAGLRQMGVITAIATGRSLYSFQKIIAELTFDGIEKVLPVDYVIFSTGASIMNFPACTILKKYSLAAEEVIGMSAVLDECRLDYMIHRSVPDTKHFIYRYSSGLNSDFQTRLDLYREFGSVLTSENLADFGEATQLLCIVDRERGEEVTEHLSTLFSKYSVIKATSPLDRRSVWVEIFASEVSKSRAVGWLSERVGVPQSGTGAVGNDYNDEDLLDWAGRGYLVANGPSSLQLRHSVVASNNDGGVAEAVYRWLRERVL